MTENPEQHDAEGRGTDSADGSQNEPQSPAGIDWRIVLIVGLAALLLIAAYINKKYFSKEKAAEVNLEATTQQTGGKPGSNGEDSRPKRKLTPNESLARMIVGQQAVTMQELFVMGKKLCIMGDPATQVRNPKNPRQVIDIRPGRLFDISKMYRGISPRQFQRRRGPGGRGLLYADNLVPLGADPNVKMVFKSAEAVTQDLLKDDERVVGIVLNGEARAYPVKMLLFHDVANDTVGGKAVAVSYSVFGDAATAMLRTVKGGPEKPLVFGTTGLMLQITNVLYDLATESFWWTVPRVCVAGELAGKFLEPVRTYVTKWANWKKLHPKTTVLVGTDPGYKIDYSRSEMVIPQNYLTGGMMLYPVYGFNFDTTPMRMKATVFGVLSADGQARKAYALRLLKQLGEGETSFKDKLGKKEISLRYDKESEILSVADAAGKALLVERMFWGAWFGAHPRTEVWQREKLRADLVEANKKAMRAQVEPAGADRSKGELPAAPGPAVESGK